ncbi:hypothetical protein BCR44DRAFT_1440358 [Catenaria anguillulae PL171]|uniref:Uncharacterized protein n=1 Tax=Catenaria anguillulae PL171 TaxID=765915 RepID=A0A1Y2HCP7_9FUNG|nr:hypothetical protein BCR44DRAFT_1440358 [Catenaria anguillulae PL171]
MDSASPESLRTSSNKVRSTPMTRRFGPLSVPLFSCSPGMAKGGPGLVGALELSSSGGGRMYFPVNVNGRSSASTGA